MQELSLIAVQSIKNSVMLYMYVFIYIYLFLNGFPSGIMVKKLLANAGDTRDMRLIPGWGRYPGGVNGKPLQCSCLENSMDGGVWRAIVHEGLKELDMTEQTCTSMDI